jgi:hypothetical protein
MVVPNLMPYMAKAYDDLDGDGKKRLHQNMEDMASVMSKAFGLAGLTAGRSWAPRPTPARNARRRNSAGSRSAR